MDSDRDSSDVDYDFDSDNASSDDEKAIQEEVEEGYNHEVLTVEEVAEHEKSIVSEVVRVVQLSPAVVRILLNHFKWDKINLLEKFYESDPESFFKNAHIMNPFEKLPISKTHDCPEPCGICLSVLPPDSMTGLECGHRFCLSCWREYLTRKILAEGIAQTISCPAHACDILVDNITVVNLAPELKIKYQQLMISSFVECNKRLRWCPSVDCPYVIRVPEREQRRVRCKCGHVFCFFCGESWHEPVKCVWLQKWNKTCEDDSATSNWLALNTKQCPRCNVTIEKDGGCNHVICQNPCCRYSFCWVCLGPWEPHGSSWYSCNRFEDVAAIEARNEQEKQRAELAVYLHYLNRYVNHRRSLQFEHKLYKKTAVRMEELQLLKMSWTDVQFLKEAVDVLCQCRQTLMYTYVFAFYIEKNNQLTIFQDNQKDLEYATEGLSEYLERDLTSEYLVDLSVQVQNKYRYCENRRKALLNHVQEGYEKRWWKHVQ